MGWLPKDCGRFKDLAAGFQSIAVIVAVVIGGAWSLYTYCALDQASQARQQRAKLERELQQQANLKFAMTVAPLALPGEDRWVQVRVEAQNLGNHMSRLDFAEAPLRVMRVDYAAAGQPQFEIVQQLQPLTYKAAPGTRPYKASILRAGVTQTYTFLARLPAPGLYWVTFTAPTSQADREVSRQAGTPLGTDGKVRPTNWATGVFHIAG